MDRITLFEIKEGFQKLEDESFKLFVRCAEYDDTMPFADVLYNCFREFKRARIAAFTASNKAFGV